MLAEPVVRVASAVMFLTTLAFFAAIVFVPLFLQLVTGASATESGLLLLPLLLAGAAEHRVVRARDLADGPLQGVPRRRARRSWRSGCVLLSGLTATTSQATGALVLVVFGAGFGMVSQVLLLAVHNAVDRRDLGIATGATNLFRALGGSFGVALFGTIFASRVSAGAGPGEIADALDTVFLAAAPVAALGLVVVLFLKEKPLRGASAKAATA